MKYLILNGSPKKDGLCHSVTQEIIRGAEDGGAEVRALTFEKIKVCRCCGDGWGTCYGEHKCSFGDDGFNEYQAAVREADALCVITPVYWGGMSEPLKAFTDRLRRCENPFYDNNGALAGKVVLYVAVPGGSGGGTPPCFEQFTRFSSHTKSDVFDFIHVNRWNADYKRVAAYSAAKAMAEGRKPGETV